MGRLKRRKKAMIKKQGEKTQKEVSQEFRKSTVGLYKCPLLSATKMTMQGIRSLCESRIKVNERKENIMVNAAVSNGFSGDILIGAFSFPFPSCYKCKDYKDIAKGKITDNIKHIQIIEV